MRGVIVVGPILRSYFSDARKWKRLIHSSMVGTRIQREGTCTSSYYSIFERAMLTAHSELRPASNCGQRQPTDNIMLSLFLSPCIFVVHQAKLAGSTIYDQIC